MAFPYEGTDFDDITQRHSIIQFYENYEKELLTLFPSLQLQQRDHVVCYLENVKTIH